MKVQLQYSPGEMYSLDHKEHVSESFVEKCEDLAEVCDFKVRNEMQQAYIYGDLTSNKYENSVLHAHFGLNGMHHNDNVARTKC